MPRAIHMCKIMKNNGIKSDFKEIFMKLATNDRSDKMFLLTSKFRPQGVVSPCPGAMSSHEYKKLLSALLFIRTLAPSCTHVTIYMYKLM